MLIGPARRRCHAISALIIPLSTEAWPRYFGHLHWLITPRERHLRSRSPAIGRRVWASWPEVLTRASAFPSGHCALTLDDSRSSGRSVPTVRDQRLREALGPGRLMSGAAISSAVGGDAAVSRLEPLVRAGPLVAQPSFGQALGTLERHAITVVGTGGVEMGPLLGAAAPIEHSVAVVWASMRARPLAVTRRAGADRETCARSG